MFEWTAGFAYAVGLITTDGCLSKDGRHIDLTSKDWVQVQIFKSILKLTNKIGRKSRARGEVKKYYCIQFGNVKLYRFFLEIGLTPAKSKTLTEIKIPGIYFRDFLRGCIDGDGNINVSRHPESRFPQLTIRISSASIRFLEWIKHRIELHLDIKTGWISNEPGVFVLNYRKSDSLRIIDYIYYDKVEYFLLRKYQIIERYKAQVAELVIRV